MAAIGRTELLEDIIFWLPTSNTLSNSDIAKLYEIVINDVGDDDANYEEVLCKSLKSCAIKNKIDAIINQGAIKFQKAGTFSESYYQGAIKEAWENYLKELPGVCSSEIGYTFSTENIGNIYMNPGDTIDVNDTDETTLAL